MSCGGSPELAEQGVSAFAEQDLKAVTADIQGVLAGRSAVSTPDSPPPLREPLRESEIRVLRYLSTNLTAPEIACELPVSPHTIKTHRRHLYTKLGTHTRTETVDRALGLGLLAPSPHPRSAR